MLFFRTIAIVAVSLFFISSQAYSIEFPPPKYTTTYHTVKKGEDLTLLAGYYMLNPREWRKIREWNNGEIKGSKIYPGQELLIFVNKKWEPPFDLDAYVAEWILGQGPEGASQSEEDIEVIQGPSN